MTNASPSSVQGRGAGVDEARQGAIYGFAAYLLWGAMPWYFHLLSPAGPWEILAERVLFSLVVCAVLLAVTGRVRAFARRLREPALVVTMLAASVLIAANWVTYLIAVTSGRVTEASLGYFLNPLVSVALGMLFLGERLRPAQAWALGLSGVGAVVIALDAGRPSWIALTLAFSFGVYGLVKKHIGAGLGAVESLTGETVLLAPVMAALVVWLSWSHALTYADHGLGHAALLSASGVITAVPLILFAAAASRAQLVTLGLLQFLAPVLQFITGLLMGEHMSTGRWVGFVVVWAALVVLVADSLRTARARRRDQAQQ